MPPKYNRVRPTNTKSASRTAADQLEESSALSNPDNNSDVPRIARNPTVMLYF